MALFNLNEVDKFYKGGDAKENDKACPYSNLRQRATKPTKSNKDNEKT